MGKNTTPEDDKTPSTGIYLDGGLVARLDNIIVGGSVNLLDIPILESFVESVVLYDAIILAFNFNRLPILEKTGDGFISKGMPTYQFLSQKKIGYQLDAKAESAERMTQGHNSYFAMAFREQIANMIVDSEPHDLSGPEAVLAFRERLSNRMKNESNLIQHMPDEVLDLLRIARKYDLSLAVLPEWQAMIYPSELSWRFAEQTYMQLAEIHKRKIEELMSRLQPHAIYIPPLLSIVLDQCKDRDHFFEAVLKVREDFVELREAGRALENRIQQSTKLGEQIEVMSEYEASMDSLVSKIEKKKPRMLQVLWDIAKKGSLTGIGIEVLNRMYHKDIENQKVSRLDGFHDLWFSSMSMRANDYTGLLEKVFGPLGSSSTDAFFKASQVLENSIVPAR